MTNTQKKTKYHFLSISLTRVTFAHFIDLTNSVEIVEMSIVYEIIGLKGLFPIESRSLSIELSLNRYSTQVGTTLNVTPENTLHR